MLTIKATTYSNDLESNT
ncbi:hypothetical protein EPr2_0058 [Providencia phage EPr2]|uniref:Uncharacterized protein n=1 Tax=Providencia phage EPr2 TaxID=2917333 RepID=A0AC61TT36_9CAUD|nr:hypothetical protein EPr2_0058 [Providencia phage EPr2]